MDPDSVIFSVPGCSECSLHIYHLTILTQRSGDTCHSWKHTYCSCSNCCLYNNTLHRPWEHKRCRRLPELFFSKSKANTMGASFPSSRFKLNATLRKSQKRHAACEHADGILQLILNFWASECRTSCHTSYSFIDQGLKCTNILDETTSFNWIVFSERFVWRRHCQ